MTALNGPILFDSSTGSDTAASGLGPATALSGAGASTTAASAVVTGITTTGVSAGDLLWVQSSSGRQFSVVASVDSGTQVTCDDVFANTEASRTWAIGGKRQTITGASAMYATTSGDAKGGWVLQMEDGFTETLSVRFRKGGDINGPIVLQGDPAAATRPVITNSGSGNCLILGEGYDFRVQHFDIVGNGSGTGIVFGSGGGGSIINDITFGSASNKLATAMNLNLPAYVYRCTIKETTGIGIFLSSQGHVDRCYFENTIGSAIKTGYPEVGAVIENNIINNCGEGIEIATTGNPASNTRKIAGNVIYNATTYGIGITSSSHRAYYNQISGNLIVGSSYGIYYAGTTYDNDNSSITDQNAFYNMTTANYFNSSGGTNDITLAADPFTDAANGDFSLNSDAGGGAVLRAVSSTMGSTTAYPFNWLTDGSGGGGGPTNYNPFKSPTFR